MMHSKQSIEKEAERLALEKEATSVSIEIQVLAAKLADQFMPSLLGLRRLDRLELKKSSILANIAIIERSQINYPA